jgi:uncharacterized protein YndB with AHSA1/START domain
MKVGEQGDVPEEAPASRRTVERATIEGKRVTATTVVSAPPEAVFALLANPHRHHEFDGSGTVRRAVSAPQQLTLGARFGMDMKTRLPYRITNRVVEFQPDRRIAWCHFAKAVWRYELEPVPGGTRITETFDYGSSPLRWAIELAKFPTVNARSIRDTLARLGEIFGSPEP